MVDNFFELFRFMSNADVYRQEAHGFVKSVPLILLLYSALLFLLFLRIGKE